GSQCLEPEAYTRAMALAAEAIASCGVPVDIVDIGGGFPVRYPDMTVPPLRDSIAAIEAATTAPSSNVGLWGEPGRALVAPSGWVARTLPVALRYARGGWEPARPARGVGGVPARRFQRLGPSRTGQGCGPADVDYARLRMTVGPSPCPALQGRPLLPCSREGV